MNLFKRKKRKKNNFDYLYDEDGYFIGTSDTYDTNGYKEEKEIYQDDGYDKNNEIRETLFKKKSIKKIYKNKKNKKKELSFSSWDDNSYIDYGSNLYYEFYDDKLTKKESINIKVLTFISLYIFFLILGVFNTTFQNGYKPQIVNAEIKSQRVIYHKAMDKIKFIEELDTFKGIQELQELAQTGHYQERIPPLQSSLKKVNRELESLQSRAYKIKETDYLKVEMLYMVNDLLTSQASTLQLAIQYYQQLSGYASANTPQILELQNQLLDQYNQYKTKLANYKVRFEQIKENDLLLID